LRVYTNFPRLLYYFRGILNPCCYWLYLVDADVFYLIDDYLLNRYQKVDINGSYSNELLINISVLQGSILGPLLFLCYINDIYTATDLATFLFADDTSCLAEHNNLNHLINYVNAELKKLANWFLCNKMAVITSKTKFITFRTKGKKIPNDVNIVFNCNEFGKEENPNQIYKLERIFCENPNESDRSYKLLGVYLDEFLNFDKHFSYLCSKLSRSLYCIKRVSNILSLKALRSLYFALIHPHLLYCSTIISCTSIKNINRIFEIQKKSIRIITKSKVNAHTVPLFLSSNILPFDKIIEYNV
jgi:Reverse transcriptase (RNA-dependent DNA polymerase)